MFKGIPNSPLDQWDQIRIRMQIFNTYGVEGLSSHPDPIELVRCYHEQATNMAAFVDQVLSKVLTGLDLLEYAGRIRVCVRNIQALAKEVRAAEARPNKWLDIPRCVGHMAYLEGELKGLMYTAQDHQEQREAA